MTFSITQDQTQLLTLSLQNMKSSLLWGGLFAFAVLFLFMGNWREPLIMGIVLPVSLLLAFSLLWSFGVTLNIISLSGLALGLGMLVDNSVVVIDSIMMKRRLGVGVIQSCIAGTSEVMAPLLSSALTNLTVFIPLIFMSGITGDLFYDQALSVAAILLASMFCTFVLVPLMYLILFRDRVISTKEDSRFFLWMRGLYHRSFLFMWKHKKATLMTVLLLFPISGLLYLYLPKQAFPNIERKETIISVDWNEPIGLDENRIRIEVLANFSGAQVSEADAGFRQYVFGVEQYPVHHATLYLMFKSNAEREVANQRIANWFQRYPKAQFSLNNAPNPFEQVFTRHGPIVEARFRDVS
jgi:multidrug efflux pump subunit AcrB